MVTVHAYAKINLTLEVLGRRADGRHEVATILQEVGLRDTLSIEEQRGLSLHCDRPELCSPQNLAYRAARLLQQEAGIERGASISIEKGIPVAAGLGGGSSDAAATLRALNEVWHLGLARHELEALAAAIGSDVSFFLHGGTALAEGHGEEVSPLPSPPPSWIVLLVPPLAVPAEKTAQLYAALDSSHFSSGQVTHSVAAHLRERGELPWPSLYNCFDTVAFTAFPGLERYWEHLRDLGAEQVHLCGSGPALFTQARGRDHGEELHRSLQGEGLEAYLVPTMERDRGQWPTS